MTVASLKPSGRCAGFILMLMVFGLLEYVTGGLLTRVSSAEAMCMGGACSDSFTHGGGERPRKHRDRGSRIPGLGGGIIITIPTQRMEPEPEFERPPPQRVVQCGPGEFFSKARRSCACRKGFVPGGEGCVRARKEPQVVSCGSGQFFSRARNSCVCRKGLVPTGNGCGKPVVVAECGKGEFYSKAQNACVCRKGLVRIGNACGNPPVIVVTPKPKPELQPEPVAEIEPEPQATPAPVREVQNLVSKPEVRNCLAPDLHDMLRQAYGRTPDVERCEAACIAKPVTFSEGKLADLTRRFGVQWCDSCVRLGGWLPLDDIRRLEQLTGTTFCMSSGENFCSAPGYARADPLLTKVKIIEKIRALPATLGKEGDVAVVIGNETYGDDIPAKTTASSDAEAVITLLVDKLGYKKQNVIVLRNATLDEMRRVFGGPDGIPGELAKTFGGREKGDVFVYVSSQGMRDEATGTSYLLPADARRADLAGSAYSLDALYDALGKVGARTTLLALEASFGSSLTPFIDPPNLPEAEASVLPDTPVPGLAVFTASDRDQRTLDDPEFGMGLFTRYLVEGMAGKADDGPTGNGDRRLDSVELYVYTANMVRTAARKSLGLEQKPQLSKVDNLLIGRLAAR